MIAQMIAMDLLAPQPVVPPVAVVTPAGRTLAIAPSAARLLRIVK